MVIVCICVSFYYPHDQNNKHIYILLYKMIKWQSIMSASVCIFLSVCSVLVDIIFKKHLRFLSSSFLNISMLRHYFYDYRIFYKYWKYLNKWCYINVPFFAFILQMLILWTLYMYHRFNTLKRSYLNIHFVIQMYIFFDFFFIIFVFC